MYILNTKNPDDVIKIFPWLIPTETETRMDIATELYGRLKAEPERTLILIAIERNITRAILIAYVFDKKRIWLWQCQAEKGFRFSRLMFDALVSWAKDKKAREIRMKTEREKILFEKRWNFKPLRNGEMSFKV